MIRDMKVENDEILVSYSVVLYSSVPRADTMSAENITNCLNYVPKNILSFQQEIIQIRSPKGGIDLSGCLDKAEPSRDPPGLNLGGTSLGTLSNGQSGVYLPLRRACAQWTNLPSPYMVSP